MIVPHPENLFMDLAQRISANGVEAVKLEKAAGRILARPVFADRDSPPFDCSSMDGFAVRICDLTSDGLPVRGEALIGQKPPTLEALTAMRISTGSPIPENADTVVPVEHVSQHHGRILLLAGNQPRVGDHIRRRGENVTAGKMVVSGGAILGPANMGALAAFGESKPVLYRRLRVAVITTGNELLQMGSEPEPWRIMDSNSSALCAAVSIVPWLKLEMRDRVGDAPALIKDVMEMALLRVDVVLTTGGVSKGQRDFIPDAVRSLGGEIVFHHLPIKPGGPVLGALADGRAIIGLPGNPVSALVVWRRFVLPCLARHTGCTQSIGARYRVELTEPLNKPHEKWNYPLVRMGENGQAVMIHSAGSGDISAAAISDGFVETPPFASGCGPFPFIPWSIA